MTNLPSKKDIENISFEILKRSKSLDVFPTPVDKIVAYSELIINNEIDVSRVHPSYLDKANSALNRALNKVRGLFDRQKKVIYLDMAQKFSRKNFVTLHETAHGILPWQKQIHDILGDDDISLNPDYNDEFEQEANYFASITLFQHDRFTAELAKLNLGIEAGMQLAKQFGGSIHAALRRYIDCSKNRCALLILENLDKSFTSKCTLRNFLVSTKFEDNFGTVNLPAELGYTWPFVQDYLNGRKFKKSGLVTLATENGAVEFSYEFFNNGYNAFVFLYPLSEKKSSRTTIILQNIYGAS